MCIDMYNIKCNFCKEEREKVNRKQFLKSTY